MFEEKRLYLKYIVLHVSSILSDENMFILKRSYMLLGIFTMTAAVQPHMYCESILK